MSESPTATSCSVHPKIKLVPRTTIPGKRKRRQRAATHSPGTKDYSSFSSSDEETILEKSIKLKASRNRLSECNIRDIIKNVVQNDLVLEAVSKRADAMDRLVEEELVRTKKQLLCSPPSGKKITRKVAKELNHTPLKILDLNAVTPDKNIAKLLTCALPSDEDEEDGDSESDYQPNYDEETDDCSITATCSDLESQPRTPCEAAVQSETEDQPTGSEAVVYDNHEGVFKLPQGLPKTPSARDKISKRTRSKLSLESLEIESLQKPHVNEDPVVEIDGDEPWLEFLDQFQKPLSLATAEEGEETDPEYVATENALNRSQGGNISGTVKKEELDSLLNDILCEVEQNVNRSLKEKLQLEFGNSIPLPEQEFQWPEPVEEETRQTDVVGNEDVKDSGPPSPVPQEEEPTDYQLLPPAVGVEPVGIIVPTPSLPMTFSLVQGSDQNIYLLPNGQYTIPLQQPVRPKPETAFLEINVNDDLNTIIGQINAQRLINYEETIIQSLVINGWSRTSLQIFHRQLLVHVQLLGQMFIQTYSHPDLWHEAKQPKRLLNDFAKRSKASPILRDFCWNVHEMLKICEDWRSELNVVNEENLAYVRLLGHEKLTDRVMERMTSHRAFLFPELLPKTAAVLRSHGDSPPSKIILLLLYFVKYGKTKRTGEETTSILKKFKKRYGDWSTIRNYRKVMANNKILVEYFQSGKVPAINPKVLEWRSYDETVPISKQNCLEELPSPWRRYLKKKENRSVDNIPRDFNDNHLKSTAEEESCAKVTVDYKWGQVQYELPQYYAVGETVPVSDEEGEGEPIQINWAKDKEEEPESKKIQKLNLHVQLIKEALKKQPTKMKTKRKSAQRRQLTNKLHSLLSDFDRTYDVNMEQINPNAISTKLYNYFKEFDIFARLLHARLTAGPLGCTQLKALPNVIDVDMLKLEGEEDEDVDPLPNQPNSSNLVNGKDRYFAWKYLALLKKELKGDNFKYFQETVKKSNQNKASIPKLYLQLEDMFSVDFVNLLRVFLVHLMPNYIAQIGYLLSTAISEDVVLFKDNLSLYMGQRDMQLELIYSLLNELTDTSAQPLDIKQNFLPQLTGNPLLCDWFLLLFPPECQEMYFWKPVHQMLSPIELYEMLLTEEANLRELPPMNLRISDSECDDDDNDDVECIGTQYPASPTYSIYSVPSETDSPPINCREFRRRPNTTPTK